MELGFFTSFIHLFNLSTKEVAKHELQGLHTTQRHYMMLCFCTLTLKVLVVTIDAQWEGMGDVGSARYEPALLPPCPTIRVLSYSN